MDPRRGAPGPKAGVEEGVGAAREEAPVARVKRGYEWVYLYGFVRPCTGESFRLILPTVNAEVFFSMALEHFAEGIGAGEDEHVLLVLDQAGWHTGGEAEVPEGIHPEFLPARSPELCSLPRGRGRS